MKKSIFLTLSFLAFSSAQAAVNPGTDLNLVKNSHITEATAVAPGIPGCPECIARNAFAGRLDKITNPVTAQNGTGNQQATGTN